MTLGIMIMGLLMVVAVFMIIMPVVMTLSVMMGVSVIIPVSVSVSVVMVITAHPIPGRRQCLREDSGWHVQPAARSGRQPENRVWRLLQLFQKFSGQRTLLFIGGQAFKTDQAVERGAEADGDSAFLLADVQMGKTVLMDAMSKTGGAESREQAGAQQMPRQTAGQQSCAADRIRFSGRHHLLLSDRAFLHLDTSRHRCFTNDNSLALGDDI